MPSQVVRPSSRQVPQNVAVNCRADPIIADDRDPPELNPVMGIGILRVAVGAPAFPAG
jgi:hypothetical protein